MTTIRTLSLELLDEGLQVRFNTFGPSMFPLIRTGDMITVKSFKSYKAGDIIVFKRGENLVCHRVRKIFLKEDTRFLQTRGDNLLWSDKPIAEAEVMGKVIAIDRGPVTPIRRLLLACYPLLQFGSVNVLVVAAIMQTRKIVSRAVMILS